MFDADLTACAAHVEKGDPPRFRTVMAAPLAVRAKLFPLYAFNLEVARAPRVTAEPMIAEMRLQWWRDALEEIAAGGPVRRHEVVTPLARTISRDHVPVLDRLIAARRWDCYRDTFEDDAHLQTYLAETSGGLTAIAAALLDGPETAAREAGFALGVANWLAAVPALEAEGRRPLVDGRPPAVRALAEKGLAALDRARQARVPPRARPAFWPVTGIRRILAGAIRDPGRVAQGMLPEASRLRFALTAALGRW